MFERGTSSRLKFIRGDRAPINKIGASCEVGDWFCHYAGFQFVVGQCLAAKFQPRFCVYGAGGY